MILLNKATLTNTFLSCLSVFSDGYNIYVLSFLRFLLLMVLFLGFLWNSFTCLNVVHFIHQNAQGFHGDALCDHSIHLMGLFIPLNELLFFCPSRNYFCNTAQPSTFFSLCIRNSTSKRNTLHPTRNSLGPCGTFTVRRGTLCPLQGTLSATGGNLYACQGTLCLWDLFSP